MNADHKDDVKQVKSVVSSQAVDETLDKVKQIEKQIDVLQNDIQKCDLTVEDYR